MAPPRFPQSPNEAPTVRAKRIDLDDSFNSHEFDEPHPTLQLHRDPPTIDAFEDGADKDAHGEFEPTTDNLDLRGVGPKDLVSLEDGTEGIEVSKWKTGGGDAAGVSLRSTKTEIDIDTRGRRIAQQLAPGPPPVDTAQLLRTLEDAEKLLRAVKSQAQGMDLSVARGMNAQIAGALNRVSEALALLRR